MIKTTENNKKESKIWNNKFWILLGTYLIAFVDVGVTFPLPIGFAFLEIKNFDISSIGFTLWVISIIGVLIIQINYRKKELEFIIFQIGIVCLMYLSWIFLTIYGVHKMQGDKDFWSSFLMYLAFSLFFQIASLVIFCKLLEKIYLLRFKKLPSPEASKVEK